MGRNNVIHTDFGNFIKQQIAKNDISQKKLAGDLGLLESLLSEYLAGVKIPEMDFVNKCIKYFNLKEKEIQESYTKYFLSTAKKNGKIIINVKFFKPERIDLLVEILTVILLYPHDQHGGKKKKSLSDLRTFLESYHNDIRYKPPTD